MAFNFNWSPLAADATFYERARDLLTTALNKSPKPPIIVDDIIVTEFNLGSVPPDLEILEIGDIAADRFRGIFKMCYTGDAFLTLKTRVQANPLNTYLSSKPSFTSPEPLAAASGLTIPLSITLSEIKLSAFIIVVFSKQKGLTLVFRNDPLESLKVSSTFDSIQFVRDYLQRTIEGKLRDLMMDELPAIIHRLSLQLWSPEQARREDENANDKANASNAADADKSDPELCVNPLADVPSDAVDVFGNPMDAGDISSLSTNGSPETQSLFSQKNLLRLAALTNSHRTFSLFTPGIREAVFRAWTRPCDRQDGSGAGIGANGSGIGGSPPFATPNMARCNSFTAAATSTNATTTTYTFSDTGSQVHGHLPARASMVSLGAATTGLSLGANHGGRHGKSSRKKKTRVVNLRKSSSDSKSTSGVSAPASEAGDTASDSISVQGPLSEPILPASIPEEDESQEDFAPPPAAAGPAAHVTGDAAGMSGIDATLSEALAAVAASAAANQSSHEINNSTSTGHRPTGEKVPLAAGIPSIAGMPSMSSMSAVFGPPGTPGRPGTPLSPLWMAAGAARTGGVLEAALAGEKRRGHQPHQQQQLPSQQQHSYQQHYQTAASSPLRAQTSPLPHAHTTPASPSGYQDSSSTVMEKEWIMKMASEIARRVYDENRKNPAFWEDRDEAPPAYEATR